MDRRDDTSGGLGMLPVTIIYEQSDPTEEVTVVTAAGLCFYFFVAFSEMSIESKNEVNTIPSPTLCRRYGL
jgi:hypothetical protein